MIKIKELGRTNKRKALKTYFNKPSAPVLNNMKIYSNKFWLISKKSYLSTIFMVLICIALWGYILNGIADLITK